jgi:hypothetical protein
MRRFLVIVAIIEAIICCENPKKSNASENDPALGGCIVVDPSELTCKLSAHPQVIQPLAAIDLKESRLMYGLTAVSPGLCYGVTYGPSKWYASGINFCLNVAHTDAGNMVFPSGVLQLVRWASVGIGGMCSESNSVEKDKLICHALLLFGANIPIQ